MRDRGGGEVDPTRIVADADVLAADLLVGGPARAALDHVRSHSWVDLLASDALIEDAGAVVADVADERLAADWADRIRSERTVIEHPSGDHPAVASAYRGNAAHLLTFEESLVSTSANLSLQAHMPVSVRTPDAFAKTFDPERLYESYHDGPYPGPDRDPRN